MYIKEIDDKYNQALRELQEGNSKNAYDILTKILNNSNNIGRKFLDKIRYTRAILDITSLNTNFDSTFEDFKYLFDKKSKYKKEACALLALMSESKEDYSSVIMYGELALQIDAPYKKEMYFSLSKAYVQNDTFSSLEKGFEYINLCIEELKDENVDFEQEIVYRIDILISLNRFDDVNSELENYAVNYGVNGTYYYLWSRYYYKKYLLEGNTDNLDKVIDNALICLQYEDNNSPILNIISNAYLAKGDFEKAIKYLPHSDNKTDYLIEKLKIYDEAGWYENGLKLTNEFLENDDEWTIRYFRGIFETRLEKYEEARNDLIDAYNLCNLQNIIFDILEVNRILKQDDQSFKFLEGLLGKNDDGFIYKLLGELSLRIGMTYNDLLNYYKKSYLSDGITELQYIDVICDYIKLPKNLQKKVRYYARTKKDINDYSSKRKMAVRFLYGENGIKRNLEFAKSLLDNCIEVSNNDSCDIALLGRYYEFIGDYKNAYKFYKDAYEEIKDFKRPLCDCASGYYAHSLINGIGTEKNIELAKEIILDAIEKSDKLTTAHIVYYYTYFSLQEDARFSKEKAFDLLNFDYPFSAFDISRITILSQLCKDLNIDSEKLKELLINFDINYDKNEKKYYKKNVIEKYSLPYWKNI